MYSQKTEVNRVTYNWFQLLIEFGGIMKFILVGVKLSVYIVGKYLYFAAMIKKLYFVKTVDKNLFDYREEDNS